MTRCRRMYRSDEITAAVVATAGDSSCGRAAQRPLPVFICWAGTLLAGQLTKKPYWYAGLCYSCWRLAIRFCDMVHFTADASSLFVALRHCCPIKYWRTRHRRVWLMMSTGGLRGPSLLPKSSGGGKCTRGIRTCGGGGTGGTAPHVSE